MVYCNSLESTDQDLALWGNGQAAIATNPHAYFLVTLTPIKPSPIKIFRSKHSSAEGKDSYPL
ncbi:MAG: hypothetical protein WBB82_03245 [Limnothrix sp.]